MIFRRLLASPAFFLISLLTLAIGIGANVAIFTVVNSILLRPLPYSESEDLMLLWNTAPAIDLPLLGHADATYFYLREETRTLESMALFADTQLTLTAIDSPQRIDAWRLTASLFDVLRVRPALGRLFREEEELPGSSPVAILSDRMWRSRFAGDPEIVGRTIELDSEACFLEPR